MTVARTPFSINGQYIRDLSFENPLAPRSLFGVQEKPTIDLAVDMKGQRLQDDSYELTLHILAKALHKEDVLFLVELVYAGVFTIPGVAPEAAEPILMSECPQVLFPFARRIIADITRDGGFPPLMLEPLDFHGLYQARKAGAPKPETVN
jgi:preprotein translocase subunit SecB